MCAVIAASASAIAAKGKTSLASSSSLALTRGSARWLSAVARPWPGMCLMQPATPPSCKPSSAARASDRGALRIGGERAVADDLVRSFDRHIEHRREIAVDADVLQFVRDESMAELRGVVAVIIVAIEQTCRTRQRPATSAIPAPSNARRVRLPGRSRRLRRGRRRRADRCVAALPVRCPRRLRGTG